MFFGLAAGLAAHDDDGNFLCVAEGSEGLQQFVTGIFRHAQVEQDGFGFGFQGKSQALFRFAGIDDFVRVAQFQAHQPPQRGIVVDNQQLFHIPVFSFFSRTAGRFRRVQTPRGERPRRPIFCRRRALHGLCGRALHR